MPHPVKYTPNFSYCCKFRRLYDFCSVFNNFGNLYIFILCIYNFDDFFITRMITTMFCHSRKLSSQSVMGVYIGSSRQRFFSTFLYENFMWFWTYHYSCTNSNATATIRIRYNVTEANRQKSNWCWQLETKVVNIPISQNSQETNIEQVQQKTTCTYYMYSITFGYRTHTFVPRSWKVELKAVGQFKRTNTSLKSSHVY